MAIDSAIFKRSELLLGNEAMERIAFYGVLRRHRRSYFGQNC